MYGVYVWHCVFVCVRVFVRVCVCVDVSACVSCHYVTLLDMFKRRIYGGSLEQYVLGGDNGTGQKDKSVLLERKRGNNDFRRKIQ